FQRESSGAAVPAERLLSLVGAASVHREGALQDHDARRVQRAALLPPEDVRVHGVRMAPRQGRRRARPRAEDAGEGGGTEGGIRFGV
ncbi:UNVERIFIED_CONTAM: hypothetical protein GTU68_049850, partial [Idotea baltica]|nr:hypothetical protein [Idotea baltica]